MNCFIKSKRRPLFYLSLVLCLLFCLSGASQTIYAQYKQIVPPLSSSKDQPLITLGQVKKALTRETVPDGNGGEKPVTIEQRNVATLAAIKARGVGFLLKPEVETELKELGANQALLNAIKLSATRLQADDIKIHNATKAYVDLGDAASNNKDYDAALDHYNQAIELNPNYGSAFNQRGKLYAFLARKFKDEKNYDEAKKHLDKAIDDLDQYIRIDSTSSTAFYNRALCYYMKLFPNLPKEETIAIGQKAIDDFTRAITLNEGAQAAYQYRAITYRLLGQAAKAAADEQKLQELKNGKSQGTQP